MKDLSKRAVETLYVEAMLLADDVRAMDDALVPVREVLDPIHRTGMAVEQMRITTRLMHVIAWLLTRRAVIAGEIGETEARSEPRQLGRLPKSDLEMIDRMPDVLRLMAHASIDLATRATALQKALTSDGFPGQGPANDLLDQLRTRLAA